MKINLQNRIAHVVLSLQLLLLCGASASAQAPSSFNYQAVLRNSDGSVKANTEVSLTVSILDDSNTEVFSETHSVTTNAYGLVTLAIGSESDGLDEINWNTGSYYISIETDGEAMGTGRMLAVPFALYSNIAGYADSSDYNNLLNTPEFADVATSGSYSDLEDTPDLAAVATSGSYDDLFDRPEFADVAQTGVYDDLINTPDLSVYATKDMDGGTITMGEGSITELATPENEGDAVNKVYVDDKISTLLNLILQLDGIAVSSLIDAGIDMEDIVNAKGLDTIIALGYTDSTNLNKLFDAGNFVGSLLQAGVDSSQLAAAGLIGTTTVDGDGNSYNWVKIGEQYWMSENLRTTDYTAGDSTLTSGTDYWEVNGDETNAEEYGRLYHYSVASGGNICPSGWHVSTDEDWKVLEALLGMPDDEVDASGGATKRGTNISDDLCEEFSYGHWNSSNSNGTNKTGFTAVGAGVTLMNTYDSYKNTAAFWTLNSSVEYMRRYFYGNSSGIIREQMNEIFWETTGLPIRCVKD